LFNVDPDFAANSERKQGHLTCVRKIETEIQRRTRQEWLAMRPSVDFNERRRHPETPAQDQTEHGVGDDKPTSIDRADESVCAVLLTPVEHLQERLLIHVNVERETDDVHIVD
jgi:hypothetical protein